MRPHLRVAGEAGDKGLIPSTDRFGTALADIVRCPRCGHMQLVRMPGQAELRTAYGEAASDDYAREEVGQRATARTVLARIERHAGPGSLLDLGCWLGYLLSEARARGWRGLGVEPSEFAAGFARQRLRLDVRRAELFEVDLPAAGFDAVFMGDVIEHIPAAAAALDRVGELIAPGGVLAMSLPDAGSRVARTMGRRWWSVIPTHVHYFTRSSVTRLLCDRGYDVLELRTSPKTFTLRYYLERVGGYREGFARSLVRTAERLGVAERLVTPDFRDRMLVIARPRAARLATPAR